MQPVNFDEIVARIASQDNRYHRDAYYFLREALDYTQKQVTKSRKAEGAGRHVSGAELVNGIRDYALQQYGPMTLTLLNEWGIRRCEDFGEIVFNMVDHQLLGKTDRDSRDDFKGHYEFEEAFVRPFRPSVKPASAATPRAG